MKRGTAAKVILGKDTLMDVPAGIVHGTDVILGGKAGLVNDFGGLVLSNNLMLGKKISRSTIITVTVRGQSPLVLPDAIGGSLQAVKAFGGTEQRNLPDGYTQLVYIVFDATQVIDTGFTPDNNSRIESKCYRTGEDCWFYGASPSNPRITLYHSRTGTCRWGNQSRSNIGFVADTEYTIIEDKNGININGVDNPWTSGTTDDFTCDRSLTIGNCNGGSGTRYFAGNFYYMKIYNNGVLVRDFVPCQNASNVVGLYDMVNGAFYTDTGLVAGPDAVPTPDTPMDIISNNGVLKARHQSGLPLGYTLLDSITGNGLVGFSTGLTLQAGDEIDMEYEWLGAPSGQSSDRFFFGTSNADASKGGCWAELYTSTGSTAAWYVRFSSLSSVNATATNDQWNGHITLKRESFTVNNVEVLTPTYNGDFQSTVLTFFGRFNATGDTFVGSYLKVKSFTVKNNGVYRYYGIPCRNTNNELTFYDTVSGGDSTKVGTGDFTAGIAVSDPVEIYTDGTVETIQVTGKNLFDKNSATMDVMITASTGATAATLPNRYSSDYIVVKPNTVYSCNGFDDTSGVYGVAYYDKNKVFVSGESYGSSIVSNKKITVPNNSSIKYIRFCSCANTSIDDCMFVESNALPVDYIPYFNGGTATAEMLLKVGDYQDVQSILDGVVTRNVGVKVFDGTENWTYSNSRFRLNIQGYLVGSSIMATIISHYKLPAINVGAIANGEARFAKFSPTDTVSDNNMLIIHDDNYTNSNSYKTWLADQYAAGTPVIVIYPLETPTTESVAGQTLQVQDGDNTLEITQASLTGLELEATYKALVQLTIQEVEDANLNNNVEVTIS